MLSSFVLKSPDKWQIPLTLKKALGCIGQQPVIKNGQIVKIRNITLCYHDLYHIEIAQLNRIKIGKHQVSGIHGINSPIFHEFPIIEEYDSALDEVRVAFHEVIVKTSVYNTIKAIAWMNWLILQKIDPIDVFWQHYKSVARRSCYQK